MKSKYLSAILATGLSLSSGCASFIDCSNISYVPVIKVSSEEFDNWEPSTEKEIQEMLDIERKDHNTLKINKKDFLQEMLDLEGSLDSGIDPDYIL